MRKKLLTALTDSVLRPDITPVPQCRLPQACLSCSLLLPPTARRPNPHRTLTTTALLSKKGGKQESKRTVPLNASKTAGLDPFDFSDFQAAVSRAHDRLKHDLSKIKAGGRDLEVIVNVRVRLSKADKEKEKVKVGDLASLVTRGRNVAVLVAEKDVSILISLLFGSWAIGINAEKWNWRFR